MKFYAKLPYSKSKIGIIINLEAQSIQSINYDPVNRAHYYNARLISTQFNVFNDCISYDDLRKVVSIWFILDPPKYKHNAINRIHYVVNHEIGFVVENLYHVNKSEIIMVYLSQDSDDEFIQLMNELRDCKEGLDDLIFKVARKHGIEIDDHLKEEIEQMCNYGQYVMNLGKEKGKIEGLNEGRLGLIIEFITNSMNDDNCSFDDALTNLKFKVSDEEIAKCKAVILG